MSRGNGAGTGDRAQAGRSTRGLVGALRVELADGLRAVRWYRDDDQELLYARDEVDALDGRLEGAFDRRSVADGRLEYAVDAYEEVVVVTLSSWATPSTAVSPSGVASIVLAVERDAPLREITAAIERAVAASRQ